MNSIFSIWNSNVTSSPQLFIKMKTKYYNKGKSIQFDLIESLYLLEQQFSFCSFDQSWIWSFNGLPLNTCQRSFKLCRWQIFTLETNECVREGIRIIPPGTRQRTALSLLVKFGLHSITLFDFAIVWLDMKTEWSKTSKSFGQSIDVSQKTLSFHFCSMSILMFHFDRCQIHRKLLFPAIQIWDFLCLCKHFHFNK